MAMRPWDAFVRSAMICALLASVVFGLGLKKIEHLPLSGIPLKFNAEKAYGYMYQLSKGFPNRITYTESRAKAALWLKEELHKMGYEPKGMLFSETIEGKQYTNLENVFVEKKGNRHPEEIIVVSAHYDVTDTTVEGAMDDASGVGTVMELARIFAQEQTGRTIIFLLTDSEEFGAFWGARAFARDFDRAQNIVGVVNFDFLAAEKQTAILTLCDGLKSGYTPLWLRELALDSLRSLGADFHVADMTNVMEHIERAMLIPPADHGAFLAEGIPAFNWTGQTKNFAHLMSYYHHTPNDVAEAMQVGSFHDMGRGAERVIRSLDELSKIPQDFRNSSYWKITSRLYLEGWVVLILHTLAFVPFLVYCLVRFRTTLKNHSRSRIQKTILEEAKGMGIVFASLLVGYVIMQLLPALKIITQYETFPATQKSLILYSPNFLAMLLVAGAVAFIYWVFRKTFTQRGTFTAEHAEIRHAFHAVLLLFTIVLAFAKNSYLATLLLLPPAYLWMSLRAKKRKEDRILNSILLLGGAITFVVMTIVMTSIFHIGVVYWYLFLAATYGLISAYAVVLFFLALTIMIRLFQTYVLD